MRPNADNYYIKSVEAEEESFPLKKCLKLKLQLYVALQY